MSTYGKQRPEQCCRSYRYGRVTSSNVPTGINNMALYFSRCGTLRWTNVPKI